MGLGYIAQKSVGIKGVTVEDLMSQYEFKYEGLKEVIDQLDIDELLSRDINYTLSGGEIKRVELFTLSLIPNIHTYLLDELDSGVDLENIGRIAKHLNEVGKEDSIVISTHTGSILKEIKVDTAYVVLDGKIICKGKPEEVWECITKKGYEGCLNCKIEEK
jgi:Fe-S cluster assembly ATP-binding protein